MSPTKSTIIGALIFATVLTAPLLLAENGTGIKQLPPQLSAPSAERISDHELTRRKASTKSGFTNAQWSKQAPIDKIQAYDVYRDSIILQHDNHHTLLPKNSIIYLPDTLKKKVVTQPKGQFLAWPKFYLNNRNWIFTHEISLNQAKGIAPLRPGVQTQFARINRLVVAIHQNNPISLLKQD